MRKISLYLDRTLAPLIILKNLKSFVRLTAKERNSLAFHAFTFQFRVLQFLAINHKEVIERAEFLPTFPNLREVDGGKMVKLELRFNKEVISSVQMDDINRMFQCLLETGHLGQMTFSELQVRVSTLLFCMISFTLMDHTDFTGQQTSQSVVERIAAFCKRSQWSLWSGGSGRNS